MGLKPLESSDVFICYINYSLRFSLPQQRNIAYGVLSLTVNKKDKE